MQYLDNPNPLVVIFGPTGVGKTGLSIVAAKKMGGEIVSADSRSFYRGMDIGTAKPTIEERQGVPHHLIDVVDPDETWSLAVFQQEAFRAIEEIHARSHLPFLVGGTGQYMRAVIEGWSPPMYEPNIQMRDAIEKWGEEIGADELHRKLAIVDREAAAKIDPRNVRRTVRALEVVFSTGELFSKQRAQTPSPFSLLLIGLKRPRQELYQRIDERIETMVANGFMDEVRSLLRAGYSPELPSMSAIGYREMTAVLEGRMTMEEAIAQIKRLTRIFVRRQANWFKESDPNIHWLDAGCVTVEDVVELIEDRQAWRRTASA